MDADKGTQKTVDVRVQGLFEKASDVQILFGLTSSIALKAFLVHC